MQRKLKKNKNLTDAAGTRRIKKSIQNNKSH